MSELQKVTRETISLPTLSGRDLKRWSPIPDEERHRIDAAIARLDPKQATPERLQRLVDLVRKSLDRVERTALSGYVELGRMLVRIKQRTPHGAFLSLFQGSANALDAPLPLTAKKAQALMRVATDPVLGDPRNWRRLPTDSWRTMDDLARLGQQQALQPLLEQGVVHRQITKRQVAALAAGGSTTAVDSLVQGDRPPDRGRDPLADVRTAIRCYDGDERALIDFLRETADELEADPSEGTK